MLKLLRYELKRLFNSRSTLIMALVCPLLVLFVLSGTMIPGLFSGNVLENINIAVLNETEAMEVEMVLQNMTSSDSIENFVTINYVSDIEEGMESIKDGGAVAFLYIPENLHEEMVTGGKGVLTYYDGNSGKPVSYLIYHMLDNGLMSINRAQQSADTIYTGMRWLGYSYNDSADEFNDLAITVFSRALNRMGIFDENTVSPFGNLIGIEYYSISVIIMFSLLTATIMALKMSYDVNSEMLDRGLPGGSNMIYLLAKIISGTIFLFLTAAIPVFAALKLSGNLFGMNSDIPATLVTILFLSMYGSCTMIAMGSLVKKHKYVIWPAFTYVFIASLFSGLIVPMELLPKFIRSIAEITGIPAIARMFSLSMFGTGGSIYLINILVLLPVIAVSLGISFIRLTRRSSS